MSGLKTARLRYVCDRVISAQTVLDPDLKPGGLDPDLEILVSDLETSHFRSKNNSLLCCDGLFLGSGVSPVGGSPKNGQPPSSPDMGSGMSLYLD